MSPPSAHFTSSLPHGSSSSSIRPDASTPLTPETQTNVSLSVNYLPTKFSNTLLQPGPRRRKAKGVELSVPKRGGGVEAFRSGEARMPGETDEDYDGVTGSWFGGRSGGSRFTKKLRWNRFKWTLFVANLVLTCYSIVGLICLLMTWFNIWSDADIVRVGNRSELIVSTIAACLGILTCIIGWAGILLNNRSFLAVYTFLLWVVFAFNTAPGYITYKRRELNLEGKINQQWSQDLGSEGRQRIQNQLGCCGYYSPFVEATVSQTCYSRSVLPGCKLDYLKFQRRVLKRWYTVSFILAGPQLLIVIAGLLCSNHVTYRFGKGMMPKAYRLSMNSMAVIMDNYANKLAEQYGEDVATDVISRSRSNLHLDGGMVSMPYASVAPSFATHNKYDSVGSRPPPEAH
ncbi:uncharacterized protein BT62DRAFT_940736 [Guyanagaster necrorhizus]|uniref:Tetraspanin Tsp2 n=1 Tax=Guyanagaster necrorhizus TaxID=856835 RepID=A0A9P7W389_9AGAR|nr:uncharacterized protein BT62DRAFT_940736 [Guyanagaster necrorhizus MCA 3950]KAG7451764.1 hypothetical protein BT62DRAFT_940736 [Guyanagaster necrorhizus MCA 3950]